MTNFDFYKIVEYIKDIIVNSDYENHVFCVGGAVRDLIMGNEIKDIDIVIDLENGGISFANWVKDNGYVYNDTVVTYPTYGTAMFHFKEFPYVEIECVQTRKEQYKDKKSRNPEATFGSLYEDAMRRDLTINSLYYNISNGKIIDPTDNGIKDIKNHVIRVTSTPDIVYEDDPLRILRCIRFSSRFGWDIEEHTFNGMIAHAKRMEIITKERIQDELNKMLLCDKPVIAMRLLLKVGVMRYVIPELLQTCGLSQNKYHFGDVFEHTMKVLDNISHNTDTPCKLELRMAALLHDIGKIETRTIDFNGNIHFYKHEFASYNLVKKILRRFKYSNDFISNIQFLVKNHMRTKSWGDDCKYMKDKSLRKLQHECKYYWRFMDLLWLIDADNKAHAEGYCLPNQCVLIMKKTDEMVNEGTDMFNYKLPIDGNDIMEVKHLEPCKEVKEYLDYALKIAFNDPLITKEKILKYIKHYKIK